MTDTRAAHERNARLVQFFVCRWTEIRAALSRGTTGYAAWPYPTRSGAQEQLSRTADAQFTELDSHSWYRATRSRLTVGRVFEPRNIAALSHAEQRRECNLQQLVRSLRNVIGDADPLQDGACKPAASCRSVSPMKRIRRYSKASCLLHHNPIRPT